VHLSAPAADADTLGLFKNIDLTEECGFEPQDGHCRQGRITPIPLAKKRLLIRVLTSSFEVDNVYITL
jgi:hypothetical protein